MAERGEEVIDYTEWSKDPVNTEVIGGTVVVSDEYHIKAASYGKRAYPNWGILKNVKTDEAFLLTERSFKGMINEAFRYLPSKIIEGLIEDGRRPDVLDIGGGRDGITAREIAREYPTSLVTNIDIVALPVEEGNFRSKPGDIMELPIDDESVDLVYSHQVLPFMNRTQEFLRHRRVLGQAERVLRPGGVAIIDDGVFSFANDDRRGFLNKGLNVEVFVGEKSYGGGFLLIVKPPTRNNVVQLARKIAVAA